MSKFQPCPGCGSKEPHNFTPSGASPEHLALFPNATKATLEGL